VTVSGDLRFLWTVVLPLRLVPDTDLLEYICTENNKDLEHLVGK